ncbi:uncharacterized protein LOC144345234 [Saccoglossus kowalevskii]
MAGPAEMWVNEWAAQVRDDYEALMAAFIAYFENADLDWVLEQELSERKQGANESLEYHAANIKSRCARLRKTPEEQLRYFRAGLQNDINSQVIAHQLQTIDEARQRARLSEIVCHMQEEEKKENSAELSAIELSGERLAQKTEQLLQQHRPQYVYNPPQFEGPRMNEGQTVDTASLAYQGRKFNTISICGICNKQGHSATGCYSREHYFSGNCYNCGKRGHIAKKCRGRAQKRI